MAWSVGQKIGNEFTIAKKLGEGGFGITYRAVKQNGQDVVIKTLNDDVQRRPDFAKLQEDFLNEALRLAKCPHPHIAKVDKVFQEGRLWCMVMDYIDGGNLADRVVQKGVLPEDEALLYIQQIGEALIVVHQQGLLHRDIKPQNIMLRKGTKAAVLIDFGIAREFTPNLTQTHTQFLTPGYAPIEQYYKREKRGAYTDVYALAAVLYSLLTGAVPVNALEREQGEALEPLKRLNPKISDQTSQAILTGMSIKPQSRPQTMSDWLEMLETRTTLVSPFPSISKPSQVALIGISNPIVTDVESLLVIQPKFDAVGSFSEGLATVGIRGNNRSIDKMGYIDKMGNWVVQPKFISAHPFSEGLALVSMSYGKHSCGYIDKMGNWVIQPKFHKFSYSFCGGLAVVRINDKCGYIDKTGNWVIQPKFNSAHPFSEELASASNEYQGYINGAGNWVVQPKFLGCDFPFREGLAKVAMSTSDKYGYIDKTGNWVIQPKFEHSLLDDGFHEGLAVAQIGDKYGYIDKTGSWVIQPKFNYSNRHDNAFSEGLARVLIDNKYGYIDKTGNWVIQPKFDRADSFSEGLAMVGLEGKYGYIDKAGNWVIQPKPGIFKSFSEGLAAVTIGPVGEGSQYGYIRNPLLKR